MKKQKEIETLADKLLYSQEFNSWFKEYVNNTEAKGISVILNEKTATIERGTFTYRKINHWAEMGLLDSKPDEKEWRKFSIMDSLWLHIIHKLRLWGLSIEQIKNVKKSLAKFMVETGKAMPVLEYCASIGLGRRVRIILVVFIDGSCAPLTINEYELNSFNGMADHLNIDINRILQQFFPSSDLSPMYPFYELLNLDEGALAILRLIQTGKSEEIRVKHKGGRIEIVESLERVDASKRIIDILKEDKYQNLEVIQKDGNIVSIVRKVKQKFN